VNVVLVSYGYPDKYRRNRSLFTHEQVLELKEQNFNVCVIDLDADERLKNTNDLYDGIQVLRLSISRFKNSPLSVILQVRRMIKKFLKTQVQLDAVIFNFIDMFYIFIVNLFKNISSKVAISHGVDSMVKWNPWIVRIMKRLFLNKISKVIAVSDSTAIYVKNALPRRDSSKVTVIYNGISFEKFKDVKKLKKGEVRKHLNINMQIPVLLTVCNLVERKGVDILLRADKLLLNSGFDFYHIIIGRGPEEERLRSISEELRITDKVEFIPYVEKDGDLAKYFKASDLFVLMSRTLYNPPAMEGFGIVYVEAQYLGIPVIGGRSGGVTSAVRDGFTGYLIDPEREDSHELVFKLIKRVLSDKKLYERLSSNAEEFASSHFSWTKYVQELKMYL